MCPFHVRELVEDGIPVVVQPSTSRIFSDKEYQAAGASISNDLTSADVILGESAMQQWRVAEVTQQ